ncbi:Protein of unknown function [Cotesia congregata]|uniref:Uncharacterized protein n=1 Tax=Cotesia congregata TaxID=51543 RepID=A0A8J2ENA7_COTCN|nr:Protein of unknown function [Cotesia congregata]
MFGSLLLFLVICFGIILSTIGFLIVNSLGSTGPQSQLLYAATYNCNWTTLDLKDSKQLIILAVRSQRPLHITIGKFAPVSLNTFAKLLKSSMGYISFLMAKKKE